MLLDSVGTNCNLETFLPTLPNSFFLTIFNIQHTFFLFQFVNEWENLITKFKFDGSIVHLFETTHSLSLSLIVQKNHTFFFNSSRKNSWKSLMEFLYVTGRLLSSSFELLVFNLVDQKAPHFHHKNLGLLIKNHLNIFQNSFWSRPC